MFMLIQICFFVLADNEVESNANRQKDSSTGQPNGNNDSGLHDGEGLYTLLHDFRNQLFNNCSFNEFFAKYCQYILI